MIRQAAQFYVSEAFYGGVAPYTAEPGYLGPMPTNGVASYNPLEPSLSGLGWKAYNPDGLDLLWTHGSYGPKVFDEITAVGFYFDTLVIDQNTNKMDIEGFIFGGIPEPTSVLLALGGIGMLAMRRRRG